MKWLLSIIICILFLCSAVSASGSEISWNVVSTTGTGDKCPQIPDGAMMPSGVDYITEDYAQILLGPGFAQITESCGVGTAEAVLETDPFTHSTDSPIEFEMHVPVLSGSQVYISVDNRFEQQMNAPTVWGECSQDEKTSGTTAFGDPMAEFNKYTYPSGQWGDGMPHKLVMRVVKGDNNCPAVVTIKNIDGGSGSDASSMIPAIENTEDMGGAIDGVMDLIEKYLKPILSIIPAFGESLNEDCTINEKVFDDEWKAYSTLPIHNDKLPLQSRSYVAQQYVSKANLLIELELESYFLKRDMEIDRLMRLELREYRNALVNNLQVNLLKSFWRLSWITYDTVKGAPGLSSGAIGLGQSYAKVFEEVSIIEKLGSGLKVVQGLTPKTSMYAINTNEVSGKVEAVGIAGIYEGMASYGNPVGAGTAIFQETMKQILPSAELTPQEIEILRTQHLKKGVLDDALQESYKNNFLRRDRIAEIEIEQKKLEDELKELGEKEKENIAINLKGDCKRAGS